jgi:hypothetical protein
VMVQQQNFKQNYGLRRNCVSSSDLNFHHAHSTILV